MKAFKQINLEKEQEALWSYISLLSLICFVVMFSPVIGQTEDSLEEKPQVKMDVQKEYDKDGNLVSYDSSWRWNWKNNAHFNIDHDSVWTRFNDHWNRVMYDIHSRDFFDSLNIHQWSDTMAFHFKDWGKSMENFMEEERYKPDKETIEKWQKQHQEFMERFKEYHNEHKKLLRKYFYEYQNEDLDPNETPQAPPKPENHKSNKI